MGLKMVVLAKQVPDTKNITAEAMTPEGTVNRAALPAIFNPEDMNALEMALEIKDRRGGHVIVITMGPPRASEVLRDCLDRGADRVILLTDRALAAGDTLATSYALSLAVARIDDVDMVLCGRQAIDGDTAQVGPQVADKLDLPQVTYVESVEGFSGKTVRLRRSIEGGYEIVEAKLPLLVTVVGSANEPRPPSAKKLMRCKKARSAAELNFELIGRYAKMKLPKKELEKKVAEESAARVADLAGKGLLIEQWTAADVGCDLGRIGHAGSPTCVKEIESVVLTGGEGKEVRSEKESIVAMIKELVTEHIIG